MSITAKWRLAALYISSMSIIYSVSPNNDVRYGLSAPPLKSQSSISTNDDAMEKVSNMDWEGEIFSEENEAFKPGTVHGVLDTTTRYILLPEI